MRICRLRVDAGDVVGDVQELNRSAGVELVDQLTAEIGKELIAKAGVGRRTDQRGSIGIPSSERPKFE